MLEENRAALSMLRLNPVTDEKEDSRGPQVTAVCTEGQGSTLAEPLKVGRLAQETFPSHFQLTTKLSSSFPDLHTALAGCAGHAGAGGTAPLSLILWPGRRIEAERPPQNPSSLG